VFVSSLYNKNCQEIPIIDTQLPPASCPTVVLSSVALN